MRTLQSVPNIGGPTTAFPNGSIIDQTGETAGTALTEILYGDLIQTFHKLKRLAAITENNLPDNETNGFQMLTALLANCLPTWQAPAVMVDFSKTKWVSYANGVYYHKTAVNTTNNPSIDVTNWALVFYWNGTKIVFSDESRIAAIEDDKADKTNVLEKDNTVVYTPTLPYHPATKAYADLSGMQLLGDGRFEADGTLFFFTQSPAGILQSFSAINVVRVNQGKYRINLNATHNRIYCVACANNVSAYSTVGIKNISAPTHLAEDYIVISTSEAETFNDTPVSFLLFKLLY